MGGGDLDWPLVKTYGLSGTDKSAWNVGTRFLWIANGSVGGLVYFVSHSTSAHCLPLSRPQLIPFPPSCPFSTPPSLFTDVA